MDDAMSLVQPYLAAYGAAALFVIIYLESMGAPVPGETAVLAASVLAPQRGISTFRAP
jgi:membrane protein DedA with SNARE-associated domain